MFDMFMGMQVHELGDWAIPDSVSYPLMTNHKVLFTPGANLKVLFSPRDKYKCNVRSWGKVN